MVYNTLVLPHFPLSNFNSRVRKPALTDWWQGNSSHMINVRKLTICLEWFVQGNLNNPNNAKNLTSMEELYKACFWRVITLLLTSLSYQHKRGQADSALQSLHYNNGVGFMWSVITIMYVNMFRCAFRSSTVARHTLIFTALNIREASSVVRCVLLVTFTSILHRRIC